MAPFAFHDDIRSRHCHACPDPHLMDVISFLSHCLACEHLVQTYVQCWCPRLTMVVSQWWSATWHLGERRNVVHGLVPMSLYTKLTTPPSVSVGPNLSHHKARVQAVGWFLVGTRKQGSTLFAAPTPPNRNGAGPKAGPAPPPPPACPHTLTAGRHMVIQVPQGADAERQVCWDLGPAW